jgi:hypothetical protein
MIPCANNLTFPQANTFLAPPAGVEGQVQPIAAHVGQIQGGSCDGATILVAAWLPTVEELARLNAGGSIYVTFLGGMNPHMVTTLFGEATSVK